MNAHWNDKQELVIKCENSTEEAALRFALLLGVYTVTVNTSDKPEYTLTFDTRPLARAAIENQTTESLPEPKSVGDAALGKKEG